MACLRIGVHSPGRLSFRSVRASFIYSSSRIGIHEERQMGRITRQALWRHMVLWTCVAGWSVGLTLGGCARLPYVTRTVHELSLIHI